MGTPSGPSELPPSLRIQGGVGKEAPPDGDVDDEGGFIR